MSDMTACLNDLSYIPLNNEQNEPTQGDIGETSNEPTQAKRNEFEELYVSANEKLYPSCDYVTRLDFMAKFTYFKDVETIGVVRLKFNLRAMVNGPINDFPARVVCLGWSGQVTSIALHVMKGHYICACVRQKQLMWHRRFLKKPHKGRMSLISMVKRKRRSSREFSGMQSWTIARLPTACEGLLIDDLKDLWAKPTVETIDVATGQKFNMRAMVLWTINDFPPRSSFFGWSGQGYKACPTCNEDTPSTRVLEKTDYVGHIRFLKKPHKWRRSLDFNGEIEDGDPPRKFDRDDIMAQLEVIEASGCVFFTPEDRKKFCQFIKGVKLPDGFRSNFKHKVTDNETNIMDLKSHDCHIMMQRLLPYGLQQYFPPDIAKPLIELCLFFKQICSQTLMVDDILKAQKAIDGEPIRPWWMYPFERFMNKLSRKIRQCRVDNDPGVSKSNELSALAYGPSHTPILVKSCVVNGVRFFVHSRDERRTTQNSGICSHGPEEEMYYGQLE
ncbi:hypothetical protein Tco_0501702 [Tanacetum coccineum]